MDQQCTCGAYMPAGSRFCPRCGAPQRPEDFPAAEPPRWNLPPPQVAPPAPPPPTISFSNTTAVRSAVFAALIGLGVLIIASALPLPGIVTLLIVVGAGSLSVGLYRHRAGIRVVQLQEGARLGWLAGLFVFLPLLALSTLYVFALSDPEFAAEFRKVMSAKGVDQAMVEQFFKAIRNPLELIMALLFGFLLFSTLAAVGGVISAWLGRPRNSSSAG